MKRQAVRKEDHSGRLAALKAKLADAERRLGRLYAAIERGIADANDPTLKERVATVRNERDIAQAAHDRAAAEMQPGARITQEKIAAFVELMRTNIGSGDTPFRRAYIRSVIDQVEVDDAEIRIIGRKSVLERLVMGGGAAPAGVPSFVREWRARRDSNSRPSDSKSDALSG
jgi:site-specific DNA recombinase